MPGWGNLMINVAIPTCLVIALAFLSASAAAESIEAARAAFSEGEYIAAADLGATLGTSEGYALAAEALAIYAHYLAEEEEKEPLLQRAMRAAKTAIDLDLPMPRPIFSRPTPRDATPNCSARWNQCGRDTRIRCAR